MTKQEHTQYFNLVDKSEHVLIAFPKEWSIDAVATSLALARILSAQGKNVDIAADGFAVRKDIAFLPGSDKVKNELGRLRKFVISLDASDAKIGELSYDMKGDILKIYVTPKSGAFEPKHVSSKADDHRYDMIVTIDAPDLPSLGEVFQRHSDMFYDVPLVNIDNDAGNEQYGNVNVVDITASSCAEIVHRMHNDAGKTVLDEDIATCLLTGLISKTRSFKTATVTPGTLGYASELVSAGARRDDIIQNLYRTRSLSTLKLWGRALARLKYDPATKMAWSVLVRQDFVHSGAEEEHLADVIDELIANSPEADIIGLIYEQESSEKVGEVGGICALVSTERHADALGLVAPLRPEGSRKMARICFPGGNILEAERSVLATVARSLGKDTNVAHLIGIPRETKTIRGN